MADILDDDRVTLWSPADDPYWAERGLCRAYRNVDFFPARGESTVPAKAVCADCPVAAICLEVALRNMEKYGIWGGTSEKERRVLRRERRDELGLGPRESLRKPVDRIAEPKRHSINHGTVAGYHAHLRHTGPGSACADCLAANRERSRIVVAAYRAHKRGDAA